MRILVLTALLCASTLPITGFASSIEEMTVSVPACSGFAGRVDVTINLTSATVWTTKEEFVGGVSGSGGGNLWTGALGGPGTRTRPLQFSPGAVPAGTLITFLVNLYEDSTLAVLLDTEEITFYCDTGELYVPPSASVASNSITPAAATPVPTLPLFGLGILVSLLGLFGLRKLRQ